MFADASALVAVILQEPDQAELDAKLTVGRVLVSALAVWETSRAVSKATGSTVEQARRRVHAYLGLLDCEMVAITAAEEAEAAGAADRFGKGRHPAKLNMGDCFSYACARVHGVPLLYKGDDFALTDIERA